MKKPTTTGLLLVPVALWCIPLDWVMGGHSVCLFRNLFGVPCYGCSMTRALFSLIHFHTGAAWNYNPLFVVVAPLLLLLYLGELWKTIRER